MRKGQPGRGSLSGVRLIEAWLPGRRPTPPCLVASLNSFAFHFHRRRAGARRVRRYLRRALPCEEDSHA